MRVLNCLITKRLALYAALNVGAAAFYLFIGWQTGFLAQIDGQIFSTHDSREYRAVADWILGSGSLANATMWRPYLYPLLLGLSYRAGGTMGVWLLNVALWFSSLNLIAVAAYRMVKSHWASAFVFLLLATNISLILLTFEALTEITAIALIATWLVALSVPARWSTAMGIVGLLLPLSLLVLVKPEFEILLAVTALLLLIRAIRSKTRLYPLAAFALCLMPVAIQVGLMVHFYHYFGISEVGDSTIRGYYLPRLLTDLGMAPDVYSGRPLAIAMSNGDVLRFVAGHPLQAAVVFASILKGNLLAGSQLLADGPRGFLYLVSIASSTIHAVALLALIPVSGLAYLRSRDPRLALLWLGAVNVFIAGGLSFWQGDRLTVIALPFWAVALVFSVPHVVAAVRGRHRSRVDLSAQATSLPAEVAPRA